MEKAKNPQSATNNQVSESINSIFDLLGRVDERVQMFTHHQRVMDEKLDDVKTIITDLKVKVQILESLNFNDLQDAQKKFNCLQETQKKMKENFHRIEMKIQLLENSNNSQENRWKTITGFIVQLIWIITAALVLYKMGINSVPLP